MHDALVREGRILDILGLLHNIAQFAAKFAAFTCFMAGAGVKAGMNYGASDEFGFKAVHNRTSVYDFNATILHLMGLDHERLSYYHNGLERRLTNVHGHVVKEVLA